MEKDLKLIPELFGKTNEEFLNHLQLIGNDRIIFSGIFGIGKTTFLNHFFSRIEVKEKYNAFHLFPVNYAVLNNEDIFKFIKYDILYEMLSRKMIDIKGSTAFLKDQPSFIKNNSINIISLFLLLIPKMGKQLFQLKQEIEKLHKEFISYNSGASGDKGKTISNLISSSNKNDGDLHEFNIVTEIIHSTLIKLKKDGKENILILDDLDRIDPNHIFRIFNVFAAHFDTHNHKNKNKFGFDKIIFACDIKNIRNVYSHFYGIDTDFNGYVDKFYSRKIFNFDNHRSITIFLEKLFSEIIYTGFSPELEKAYRSDQMLRSKLIIIFRSLIKKRVISLRQLLKHFKKDINISNNDLMINDKIINEYNCTFFPFVKILSFFFLDSNNLKAAIKELPENIFTDYQSFIHTYGESLLALQILRDKDPINGVEQNIEVSFKEHLHEIRVTSLNSNLELYTGIVRRIINPNNVVMELTENFPIYSYKELLLEVVNSLEKIGYIK